MKHEPDPNRRRLLRAAPALFVGPAGLLAGCSNSPVVKTFMAVGRGNSSQDIDVNRIRALRQAALSVRLGDGPTMLLLLDREEGERKFWHATDGALVTQYGRIVQSVGLSAGNLNSAVALEADPLQDNPFVKRQWLQRVDISPGRQLGLLVRYTWQPAIEIDVEAPDGKQRLLQVRERGVCTELDWEFQNTFWIDADGKVVRCQIWLHPAVPAISLQYFG